MRLISVSLSFTLCALIIICANQAIAIRATDSIPICDQVPASACNATNGQDYIFSTADKTTLSELDSNITLLGSLPDSVIDLYPQLSLNAAFWRTHNTLAIANSTTNGVWSLYNAANLYIALLDNLTSIFHEGIADPSQQTSLNREWLAALSTANSTADAMLRAQLYPAISLVANYTNSDTDLYGLAYSVITNCTMTNGTLQYLIQYNATLTKQLAQCASNQSCINATRAAIALTIGWITSNASVLHICTPLLPLLQDVVTSSMSCDLVASWQRWYFPIALLRTKCNRSPSSHPFRGQCHPSS